MVAGLFLGSLASLLQYRRQNLLWSIRDQDCSNSPQSTFPHRRSLSLNRRSRFPDTPWQLPTSDFFVISIGDQHHVRELKKNLAYSRSENEPPWSQEQSSLAFQVPVSRKELCLHFYSALDGWRWQNNGAVSEYKLKKCLAVDNSGRPAPELMSRDEPLRL